MARFLRFCHFEALFEWTTATAKGGKRMRQVVSGLAIDLINAQFFISRKKK
jgi:hypothetical protein